jgi:hypothetical protein
MSGVAKMFSAPKVTAPTVTRQIDRGDPALEEERRRRMQKETLTQGRESTRLTDGTKQPYTGGVLGA